MIVIESKLKEIWVNKRAKVEIVKEGTKLFFTATILDLDDNHITFSDRTGVVYTFPRICINEMKLIEEAE